jgi:RhtB (resistance to homoserine/threonine) family protein
MSPGPDFAIVLRNSLIYSRKTALYTAVGIALGIMVHVTYIMLGLGLIIAKTRWMFTLIQYTGSCYLFYIGYKGIRSKKHNHAFGHTQHIKDISPAAALRSGFLTNALNPKAMLFFISLFSVMITPHTPAPILSAYGAIIFIMTLGWFSIVALCLSGKKVRTKFMGISHWIERITGGLLILLGIRLIFMPN